MTIELGDDEALPAEALSWLRLILAPAATIEPERRCAEEAGGRKRRRRASRACTSSSTGRRRWRWRGAW